MTRSLRTLIFIFCTPIIFQAQPILNLTEVTLLGSTLSQTVDITGSGDGSNKLYVVEKRGTIRVIENEIVSNNFFLDIQTSVQNEGERGLLGLVFHPDYPTEPYIFVNYVTPQPWTTHIARFTVDIAQNIANAESEKTILIYSQPYGNHNGGDLNFGSDGFLYIGLGDGGNGGDPQNRAQNPQNLLGKILRVDIDPATATDAYDIPADNPFVGNPAILDEIWALGVRNPWRFSFDAANGDMWIADVGQGEWEEINHIKNQSGGENYGWKCFEGDTLYSSNTDCSEIGTLQFPVFAYPHDDPDIIPEGWDMGVGFSVTGGYVYRGSSWPTLQGYYVCADFVTSIFWLIKVDENALATEVTTYDLSATIPSPSTFGEGDDGELYMMSLSGSLYIVESDNPLAIENIFLQANEDDLGIQLKWKILKDENQTQVEIILQKSIDGVSFDNIYTTQNTSELSFLDKSPFEGNNYYRIAYPEGNKKVQYSNIEWVKYGRQSLFSLTNANLGSVIPIQLSTNSRKVHLSIISSNGQVVWSLEIPAHRASLYKNIELHNLSQGIYFLTADDGVEVQIERILVK